MTSTLSTDQRVTLQFRVDTLSAGTSLNQFVLGMSEFVGGYSLPNREGSMLISSEGSDRP